MSNWIRTGGGTRSQMWRDSSPVPDLQPDGGIGTVEWIDLDGGGSFLLVADGEWRTGGHFRLAWLRPGTSAPVEITGLLWPVTTRFDPDPQHHSAVKDGVVEFVDRLLSSRLLSSTPLHEVERPSH